MRPLKLLLSAVLVPLLAAPAVAVPRESSIPLPVDFQPEGIAVGDGNTFYTGSLRTGDIYRGDLRSGDGAIFVDAPPGRVAAGMRVDRGRHWLVVAGGPTGHAYVYDTGDATTVADLVLGPAGAAFVNDVAITRSALYFTDTFAPTIYKVPILGNGTFGATQPITVTGPAGVVIPGGLGLNGIDSTNRRWLIVNHSGLGILALVDPNTGVSREIPLSGPGLVPGTPDGLQLEGHTAWVVQNFDNSLARVKLSPKLTSGQVVEVIRSDLFKVPTTVAGHGRWLALVNARFDLGLPPPFGPGAPPGTTFDVVQIKP
jgi:hypothetical protein